MSANGLSGTKNLACMALILAGLPLFYASESLASVVNLNASFSPDFTNSGIPRFVDRTPVSGFCAVQSAFCRNAGFTTVAVPLVTNWFSISAHHTDPRHGAMIRVAADVRSLDLIGPEGTGERLGFNISHFHARYTTLPWSTSIVGAGSALEAHTVLWEGGNWASAPSGCDSTGGHRYDRPYFDFFYSNVSGAPCAKTALYDLGRFRFEWVSFGYNLDFPDPLRMRNGTYTGSVTYSVGPGGDIDFGDAATASLSDLTFNIVLQVNHALRISVPPGAENLTLKPPGGWGSSLAPDKLSAEQKFEISTSGGFKVELRCQHLAGSQCAIANKAGHQVPVETRLSLPAGLTMSGVPIDRHSLRMGNTVQISADRHMNNGPASLDFEVDRDGVAEMLNHRGSTYSGDVTVIWDSNI